MSGGPDRQAERDDDSEDRLSEEQGSHGQPWCHALGSAAVPLPARVSFVTLAVRDLARMSAFYHQFGWPESETTTSTTSRSSAAA